MSARRCFPWSEPARYVSLRDDDDEEFALVADLGDLDGSSRSTLEIALAEAGILIRDVASDLYLVPDPGALDRTSRRLLWAFVD